MNPDLVYQLAGALNAGATILLLILNHLRARRAKQEKAAAPATAEPVTLTGAIRVLRYLEQLADNRRGKHEGTTEAAN